MKKLLVTTTLLGSLLATPALAKTQGASLGVNIISSTIKNYDRLDVQHSNSNVSYGLDVKYAFNFGKIYVAPGLFYDQNDVDGNQYSGGTKTSANLKNSYGVKVNVGYDVNEKISVFGTAGHGLLRMANVFCATDFASATEEAFIYGAGVKYDLDERVDVSLSYEQMDIAKSKDAFNDMDFNVVRLGFGFKF